jgi:acetyl-CoA carboxylase carboxyl transferase subunit alpha
LAPIAFVSCAGVDVGASVTLEFEKPIAELERQIDELKRLAGSQQLDVEKEIAPLEKKLAVLRE